MRRSAGEAAQRHERDELFVFASVSACSEFGIQIYYSVQRMEIELNAPRLTGNIARVEFESEEVGYLTCLETQLCKEIVSICLE